MSKLLQAIEVGNVSDIQSYLKAYITGDPTDSDRSIQTALKQIEVKSLQFGNNTTVHHLTQINRLGLKMIS